MDNDFSFDPWKAEWKRLCDSKPFPYIDLNWPLTKLSKAEDCITVQWLDPFPLFRDVHRVRLPKTKPLLMVCPGYWCRLCLGGVDCERYGFAEVYHHGRDEQRILVITKTMFKQIYELVEREGDPRRYDMKIQRVGLTKDTYYKVSKWSDEQKGKTKVFDLEKVLQPPTLKQLMALTSKYPSKRGKPQESRASVVALSPVRKMAEPGSAGSDSTTSEWAGVTNR